MRSRKEAIREAKKVLAKYDDKTQEAGLDIIKGYLDIIGRE